jgi:predicted deacylase
VGELVESNIIKFNEETRKLVMKNGAMIRCFPGESLVKAAERIAGVDVLQVMLGFLGPMND